jgi:NTE family protein
MSSSTSRALVLSGGGPVGIAWEAGVAAGLAAAGADLSLADLVVGTSAGSVVGAQIALGREMEAVVQRYRTSGDARGEGRPVATRGASGEQMQKLMEAFAELFTSDAPPEEKRARIGRVALEAETVPEDAFVGNFRYLGGEAWPSGFSCTAVDAVSGQFVVWDEASKVDLVRAVASSCAVPGIFPPITIDGRRYIDGGMRSVTNADLASGHGRVLVLSLFPSEPGEGGGLDGFRRAFEDELAALRASGAQVEVVSPDAGARSAFGVNLMDPSVAPAAADAGRAQGERLGDALRSFWR